MALYHKWNVKTGFTFALQFFILISEGLGGVNRSEHGNISYRVLPGRAHAGMKDE